MLLEPYVKKLNGSSIRLAASILALLAVMNVACLMNGWEPFAPINAYLTVISSVFYIDGLIFSLKQGWSIPVFLFGLATLIGLLIETLSFSLLNCLGIILSFRENYNAILYLYCLMLLTVLLLRVTLYPKLVQYIINKIHYLKNFSLLIITGLFTFSLFKESADFKDAYYITILNLSFFLLLNLFLYRELNRSHASDRMLHDEKTLQRVVAPVLLNIQTRQLEFKTQLDAIQELLQIKVGITTTLTPTSDVSELNPPLCRSKEYTEFMRFPLNAVGTLLFIKYYEALTFGIVLEFQYPSIYTHTLLINEFILTTILSNLIDNAIEACSSFSGNKKISVQFYFIGPDLKFSVSNTGVPMTDNIIKQLFNPGFSTKGHVMPRGYGLYNVKEHLKLLHGNISTKRDVEQTIFIVDIPQAFKTVRGSG